MASAEIQHIDIDGHHIRVAIRRGQAPALLLFNGIGANLELLEPLSRQLRRTTLPGPARRRFASRRILARQSYALPGATLEEVRARIGIHSGEVVLRSLSTDLNLEYTAVGVTTHLASRMEQMAKPGSVLITSATLRLAGDTITVRSRGMQAVAGIRERVDVYEVIGAEEVRGAMKSDRTSMESRPFVGRETEMRALESALAVATQAGERGDRRGRGCGGRQVTPSRRVRQSSQHPRLAGASSELPFIRPSSQFRPDRQARQDVARCR
jgi:hypothetical protein